MKILVVQNRYYYRTGEDSTFDQEVELLQNYGETVKTFKVDIAILEFMRYSNNSE